MQISKQGGMAMVVVNIVLLIAALSLLVVAQNAKQDRQRSKEQELMFVGMEFTRALESYAKPVDAAGIQFPNDLKDLLLDTRGGVERRHLRRIYDDPMTGKAAWGFVRNQSGIVGVYSMSQLLPLRKAGFAPAQDNFKNAKGYHQWIFQLPAQMLLPTLPSVKTE